MAESVLLDVRVHHGNGDMTVIEAVGELDLNSAPPLREALLNAVGHGTVVLNASGLAFCDSVGLRIMAEASKEAHTAGANFRIASPSPALTRVLEVAGALTVFEIHPDMETALRADQA